MLDTNREQRPFEEEQEAAEPHRALTRRELLRLGLMGGGAALASYGVTDRVRATETEAELTLVRIGYEARIQRLEQELALYRALDRVGLDRLITGLLDTYDRLWLAIGPRITALRRAVETVDETLRRFEDGLPTLRGGIRALRELLAWFDEQLDKVQQLLSNLLRRAAPLEEGVNDFFGWLFDRIPFGLGDRARDAAEDVGRVVTQIPLLLRDTRDRLLDPLDQDWLSDAQGEGLKGRLFDPLRHVLLTPLSNHLAELEEASAGWRGEASGRLRAALVEREMVREKIARLDQPGANT